jgi:hypothetical protein
MRIMLNDTVSLIQATAADEEHERIDKEKAHVRRQLEIQRAEDKIAALQQEHVELEAKV